MTYAILRFPEVLGSATIVRTVCDVATKTGLSGKVNKFLCVRLSLCQTVFVPDCLCARLSVCQTVFVPDCLCARLSLWSFFVFVVLFCLCARLSLWSLLSLCQTVFVVHLSQDRWPHSLYHDVFVVSLIQNRWLHSLCHVALWSVWSKIDDHVVCQCLCVSLSWDRWIFFVS